MESQQVVPKEATPNLGLIDPFQLLPEDILKSFFPQFLDGLSLDALMKTNQFFLQLFLSHSIWEKITIEEMLTLSEHESEHGPSVRYSNAWTEYKKKESPSIPKPVKTTLQCPWGTFYGGRMYEALQEIEPAGLMNDLVELSPGKITGMILDSLNGCYDSLDNICENYFLLCVWTLSAQMVLYNQQCGNEPIDPYAPGWLPISIFEFPSEDLWIGIPENYTKLLIGIWISPYFFNYSQQKKNWIFNYELDSGTVVNNVSDEDIKKIKEILSLKNSLQKWNKIRT